MSSGGSSMLMFRELSLRAVEGISASDLVKVSLFCLLLT